MSKKDICKKISSIVGFCTMVITIVHITKETYKNEYKTKKDLQIDKTIDAIKDTLNDFDVDDLENFKKHLLEYYGITAETTDTGRMIYSSLKSDIIVTSDDISEYSIVDSYNVSELKYELNNKDID